MEEHIAMFLTRFNTLKTEVNTPSTLSWLARERQSLQDLCQELEKHYNCLFIFIPPKGSKHTFITVPFDDQFKEYEHDWREFVTEAAELAKERQQKEMNDILQEMESEKTEEDYNELLNKLAPENHHNNHFDPQEDDPAYLIEEFLNEAWLLEDTISSVDEEWSGRYTKAWEAWHFFTATLSLDFSGINKRWLAAPELFIQPHVAQTEESPLMELYNEAVKTYSFGCKIAAIAMCRALMEHILKKHYGVKKNKLADIIATAENKFEKLKGLKMDEKRMFANTILHNYESGINIEDLSVIEFLRTIKALVQDVPKKNI